MNRFKYLLSILGLVSIMTPVGIQKAHAASINTPVMTLSQIYATDQNTVMTVVECDVPVLSDADIDNFGFVLKKGMADTPDDKMEIAAVFENTDETADTPPPPQPEMLGDIVMSEPPATTGDDEGLTYSSGFYYIDGGVVFNDEYKYQCSAFNSQGDESDLAVGTLKVTQEIVSDEDDGGSGSGSENDAGTCTLSFNNLKGENQNGAVALNWNNCNKSSNNNVTKVYRDNRYIGQTTETSFIDKSANNGEHTYKIETVNKKANLGGLVGAIFASANAADAGLFQTAETRVTVEKASILARMFNSISSFFSSNWNRFF